MYGTDDGGGGVELGSKDAVARLFDGGNDGLGALQQRDDERAQVRGRTQRAGPGVQETQGRRGGGNRPSRPAGQRWALADVVMDAGVELELLIRLRAPDAAV